ncbi:MAG: OmpA family protein [Gallionella sp.]
MNKLFISLVMSSMLVACASNKPPEAETAPEAAADQKAETKSAAKAAVAVDPLNDASNILAKRSIFYPIDVSVVQGSDKPLVQAHAKYLAEHANRNIRIEGNADERGSNEYNLALGQHRADGVKKMMVLGGAKSSQIDTVSYGEEKPRAGGHSEAAWSQNRRSDIKY